MEGGFKALQRQLEQQYGRDLPPYNPSIDPDEDTQPVKKMPVSYLQELCVRRNVTPVYDMKTSTGQSHDPIFVYAVNIEDLSGMGRGKSKKVARHLAARDALYRIVENNRYADWGIHAVSQDEAYELLKNVLVDVDTLPGAQVNQPPVISSALNNAETEQNSEDQEGATATNTGGLNAVGKLFEFCARRKWMVPQYDVDEESGLSHDKTFVMSVKLGSQEALGKAKSKKLAKRNAAEEMLKLIERANIEELDKELTVEVPEEDVEKDDDEKLINFDPPCGGFGGEILDESLNGQQLQPGEVSNVDGKFEFNASGFGNLFAVGSAALSSTSKQEPETEHAANSDSKLSSSDHPDFLDEVQKTDLEDEPGLQHKQLLQKIADARRWSVSYLPLAKTSKDGQKQCLVSVEDIQTTCIGCGADALEAEFAAALMALDYLKINWRKLMI